MSQDLQKEVRNESQMLLKIVTSDECWCYDYGIESKRELSQGNRLTRQDGRICRACKPMLNNCVFMWCE